MRLTVAVENWKPCKRRLREKEAEQELHTRRANEAAVKARRKLSAVKLIIETADDSERLFGRDPWRSERAEDAQLPDDRNPPG